MGAITTVCCDRQHDPPSRTVSPRSKIQSSVPAALSHSQKQLRLIKQQDSTQKYSTLPLQHQPTPQKPQQLHLSQQLQSKPLYSQQSNSLHQHQIKSFHQQDPEQQQQQQFYDIEELVQSREKSNLQPQRVSMAWFDLLTLVGQGSFGSVYLVRCKQEGEGNQKWLAMKQIKRQFTSSKKVMSSLLLERRILATATCRFIVELKYAFTDRNHLYLVMEYASGGDASRLNPQDLLKDVDGKTKAMIIKFLVACVILGLEYLHSIDIIYRDLKPQNILLFSNGYAKLSDFGLAKYAPPESQKCTTVTGTALYNAPQIVLQSGYDRSVDFWALGVLIYELCTGQPPFKLQDVSSKLRYKRVAQQEEVNRKWRGLFLEPVLVDLVGQLLRFKPGTRLGVNGFQEIRQHKYFQEIDWELLREGQLESPLKALLEANSVKLEQRMALKQNLQTRSICIDQEWDYECLNK